MSLRSGDPNSWSTVSLVFPPSHGVESIQVEQFPKIPLHYRLPQVNPAYFQRNEILKALEAALLASWQNDRATESNSDQIRTFALCGGAGSGKTQIAAHFASVHKDHYDAIFWLPAQDATKLWTAFEEIANELSSRSKFGARDMIASRDLVRKWLSSTSTPAYSDSPFTKRIRWLMIFDNVEEPDLLQEIWPWGGSGHVLITSQHRLTKRTNFFGQHGIQIEPLDKHLSVQFLRQMTQGNLRPDQTFQAAQLAEILGGLPLALVSVSHLINEGYLNFEGQVYERMYRKRESLINSSRVRSIETNKAYDHVESVVFTQLESLRRSTTLMDVLSLLDPDRVQEDHLKNAARYVSLEGFPRNENAYHDARAELLKASLVIKSGADLSMHRTIQELAIVRMGPSRFQKVFEATVDMLSSLWPDASFVARHSVVRWDECAGLLPHVLRLNTIYEDVLKLELSANSMLRFAELLNNASW